MPDVVDVNDGDELVALVVSDIHAHAEDVSANSQSAPSWVRASAQADDANTDALVGLKALVAREKIGADYVICCGDVVDKASPTALSFVWNQLQEIRNLVGARQLLVTSGNHDLDSRHLYNAYDAKGELQALSPAYPHNDEVVSDKYWSRHFFVLEGDRHRVVVLNSAAYHGESDEWQHGRVSSRTLQRVRESLGGHKQLNVLILHHHLVDNPHVDDADYSVLRNAADTLAFLSEPALGPWVVVHGHKHYPRLTYGGHSGVAIFSAGSLGAKLYPELAQRARNQVYELRLRLDSADRFALDVAGRFRAWDFSFGIGWQPASEGSGLPSTGGFGFRESLAGLAGLVEVGFTADQTSQSWDQLCTREARLEFLSPEDVGRLRDELVRREMIVLPKDSRHAIAQVVRP